MKRINRSSCLLLSLAAMFSLSAGSIAQAFAPADFFVVNSCDNLPGSLRFAINQANQQPGSTVHITDQVTQPIDLTTGELHILADMTIRNDSGALVEIRQCKPDTRVIRVSLAGTLDITGVTALTPLVITGGAAVGHGGGILVDAASNLLTLSYVHVIHNSAVSTGGGIYSVGSVTLNTSFVEHNHADRGGGGISVNCGAVMLTGGSSVSDNQAPLGPGGGIAVGTGSVFVSEGSHVDCNSAFDVGGIMVGVCADPSSGQCVAVCITGGSTVNGNSSARGEHQNTKFLGGGGIAVVTDGDVYIEASQVCGNETVGMYSGGIVVGLGDVTVTHGSQINCNSNNGPGGGIAANFGGKVSVSVGSQVNYNTGAAIGGGIVNFSGPFGSVEITGGSQVNYNILTNGETLGRAIAVAVAFASNLTSFHDFAIAIGGDGGVAMLEGLERLDEAVRDARGPLRDAVRQVSHPLGVLVAGGGIGTLRAAPIRILEGSQVNGNFSGENVLLGNHQIVGLAGGIFHVVGGEVGIDVEIDQSQVDDNHAPNGDGGGIWLGDGRLTVGNSSSIAGNSSGQDGGGIWNRGVLDVCSSDVCGNTAAGAGGGLFNSSESCGTVLDSIFQGNQAESGGGMANEGTLAVIESIVADNVATDEGGGIFCNGGDLTLCNVVFDNNSPDDVAGN